MENKKTIFKVFYTTPEENERRCHLAKTFDDLGKAKRFAERKRKTYDFVVVEEYRLDGDGDYILQKQYDIW